MTACDDVLRRWFTYSPYIQKQIEIFAGLEPAEAKTIHEEAPPADDDQPVAIPE